MRVSKESMLLYVVTDRTWLGQNNFIEQVEQTIASGATFLQLREKSMPYDEFVNEANEIKKLTDRYRVPFVINDSVEVALAAGADGVHVGQSDRSAKEVRKLLGSEKILGVSVSTPEEAILAEQSGADYLGVGAVFSTSTKQDATTVSYETLQQICNAVSLPVVAIGGISESNVLQLKGSGINGVAVISAIFAKRNIAEATARLRSLAAQTFAL